MAFEIRDNRTNEPLVAHSYTTMGSAKRAFGSRGLTKESAYIADLNWPAREAARKNLIDLREFGLILKDMHFLHVSDKNIPEEMDLLVSYTESDIKGSRNLQSSGRKIGRYLQEFYPELDSVQIRDLAASITAKVLRLDIQFARTREEIKWVYTHSSQLAASCMTHPIGHYNTPRGIHPTEAYASPDLEVAYLVKDGMVSARTLVVPGKKVWVRLYGTEQTKLKSLLVKMGYTAGSSSGARMLKIPNPDMTKKNIVSFVCPYLDGIGSAHMTDEYLVMGSHPTTGEHSSHNAEGYINFTVYQHIITKEMITNGSAYEVRHPETGEVGYLPRTEVNDACRQYSSYYYLYKGFEDKWDTDPMGATAPRVRAKRDWAECPITKKRYDVTNMIDVGGWRYVSLEGFLMEYATDELTGRRDKKKYMKFMEHNAWWSEETFAKHGMTKDGKNYAKMLVPSESKVA